MADGGKCFFPPPGGFTVQQVQQIHKRPCLQWLYEFFKVQQKCNISWLIVGELMVDGRRIEKLLP